MEVRWRKVSIYANQMPLKLNSEWMAPTMLNQQIPGKCIHDANHGKYLMWEFKVLPNQFTILNTHHPGCSGLHE